MVGVHGRDSYGILPPQIKLCRGAKGDWPLGSLAQLRPSDSPRRCSYQEIPPPVLKRPILPFQWGNLEVPKRSSFLRPRPMLEHGSLIVRLMSEEHLFRVLRTYDSVTKGLRRQAEDMVRVGVGQEVQFRRDGVVRR